MFVQTFATVRSCILPFLTCCSFEPNCAHNFSEGAEGRRRRGVEDEGGFVCSRVVAKLIARDAE